MVGDTYTQVLSGLSPGQSVVLADYAEAVPSSNTDTRHLGGGGGGGFGGGGGGRRLHAPRQRAGAGGGGALRGGGGWRLRRADRSPWPPPSSTTVAPWRPIRLDQVNLVVRDVEASRAFYARLGLDFGDDRRSRSGPRTTSRPLHGDATPIDVDLDSTAFATKWNEGWPGGPGAVLGFKVDTRDEVDDLVAALAAEGVPVQQQPYDAFWGARYAVVSDPDGNGVGIMSPVDPALRSEAPSPS